MLWCRHFETGSDLLLMRLTGDSYQLSLSCTFLTHGFAWSITDQSMFVFSLPFLFISQKWFDSSVEFTLTLELIVVLLKSVFKCILCKTVVIDWCYSISNCLVILVPCLNNFLLEDDHLSAGNYIYVGLGFLIIQDSVCFYHVGKIR